MKITLKRVTKNLAEYSKVQSLYENSFPDDEKAPFWLLMVNTFKPQVDFWSIYIDKAWVGMIYVISQNNLSYVFYFAVAEGLRGKGYGSLALRAVKRHYENSRLFLAVEQLDEAEDNYSQRLARRKFYEKNGFSKLDRQLREASVVYDLMGIGGNISADDYAMLMDKYMGTLLRRFFKMSVV